MEHKIGPNADLRSADLHDADLHDADLHSADLHGADLHGADLSGANLYGANLYGVDLHNANLSGANLHDADLHGADLSGANGILFLSFQHDWSLALIRQTTGPQVLCGCRWFTVQEAIDHWSTHPNSQRQAVVLPALSALVALSVALGWEQQPQQEGE